MSNRTIVLIDMDAFFAQIEQRHNPVLRGKPILVTGGPGRHAIVTTASYEAKRLGVKSAMSLPEALRLCPHALTIICNPDKYIDYCYRLLNIYKEFTDLVEPYSIDEAFLDITSVQRLFGTPQEIGQKIKKRIKQELDLTCSIGIGPNKLIAKMSAEWQKPDGLTIVNPEDVPQIIWHMEVEELVGVGHRMKIHLNSLGIKTIEDLAKYPAYLLKAKFGKYGEILHQFAWGIDNSSVDPKSFDEIKSVGHSYTLPKDVTDLELIKWYIYWLSSKVARRLEKEGLAGRTIHLYVRSADFNDFGVQTSISEKTNYPQKIASVAYELFLKNYDCPASISKQGIDQNKKECTSLSLAKNRGGVRLLGVSVSNVSSQDQFQLDLFYDSPRTNFQDAEGFQTTLYTGTKISQKLVRGKPKMSQVLNSIAQVKNKYGDDVIELAVLLLQNKKRWVRQKVGCFLTPLEKRGCN
jgi:DNA polymerase-4